MLEPRTKGDTTRGVERFVRNKGMLSFRKISSD
jgi:hypothetical protein